MSEPRHPLQFRDMVYQSKLADIFAVDAVIATLERDAMIPDRCVSFYLLMQISITVIGIHLELVGFHQPKGTFNSRKVKTKKTLKHGGIPKVNLWVLPIK